MSVNYRTQRIRNLYQPNSQEPYKLSRSALELFVQCPRCFYLDRRLGKGRPPGYPFNLNNAVDALLKKEFDIYRQRGEIHPMVKEKGIEAIPFQHPDLEKWRSVSQGIQYIHPPTSFLVYGAVDDLWINETGELIVVDYKATSKIEEVALDQEWQNGYRRQAEVYQWLLRQNGFAVSPTAYFYYCNGDRGRERFDNRLEFRVSILPYIGSDAWIEPALINAKSCLDAKEAPLMVETCDYCRYVNAVKAVS
jgi:RecB family exonuclease